MINSQHKIKQVRDHYEVWDIVYNSFICSGDTQKEVEDTFVELFKQKLQQSYIN